MARTTHARGAAGAPRMIALLRAVNVGGRGLLMADLQALVDDLGYIEGRTLLQTGNVVFRAGAREKPLQIEQRLEQELQARLSLASAVFVRNSVEWAEIVATNPFLREAESDPSHLLLMLLKATPSASAVDRLRGAITGCETVAAADRRLYIVYPDGIGRSKLTNTLVERTLGTAGTARNWNTVLKLAALAAGAS
jgi:uncharacterized protein (DUF1697 family)